MQKSRKLLSVRDWLKQTSNNLGMPYIIVLHKYSHYIHMPAGMLITCVIPPPLI